MLGPALHSAVRPGVVAVTAGVAVALVALGCGELASSDCAERASCAAAVADAAGDGVLGDDGEGGANADLDSGPSSDLGSIMDSVSESVFDSVADSSPDAAADGGSADGGTPPAEAGMDGSSDVAESGSFDVVAPEASDGGGDAGDGAADTGPAGLCVTSIPAGGQLLFSFDAASSAAGWYAEISADGGAPAATLAWSGADGHTCPGALTLTVAFAAYTSAVPDLEFDFAAALWKATKLHMWVKVRIPSGGGAAAYSALSAVSPFIQSNNWTSYTFMWLDVPSGFGNGAWNEVVVDLIAPDGGQANRFGPDVDLASVQRLGVSLADLTTRPDGGPAAPSPTVLLLDDIWLE